MPADDAAKIRLWKPEQYPPGSQASQGACRFAPMCGGGDEVVGRKRGQEPKVRPPDFPTCPGAPAEFSEQLGGDALGGYARYMALCRAKALERHGRDAVERTIE